MKNVLILIIAICCLSCKGNAQKNDDQKKFEVSKTDAEWKKELSDAQFKVLRKAGTERAFTSELLAIKEPGTFVCAACGNEIYRTKNKFKSGSGWPSFDRAIEGGVAYGSGYQSNEIHCARCGSHLGHMFNDGPAKTTGKRHCINGIAMDFIPKEK
ncbi:peptide-methionine (R)-S-oxide reductase MsrB [Zunongwangia sp.]|uniref:peptide-methionine (R)-S-oxide reductase MsrB n=1 Tax=Zunongwangia sp. TaxID=1965325 RepID=UPI003AA8DC44